jgi:hypothetical protein
VLHQAWIQALLDVGDFDTALPEIESGIADSRWKSSWLLMRARIYQAQNQKTACAADAKAAWEEIQSRLSSNRPDPHLLIEAAQALAFLNKSNEAEHNLKRARALGVSFELN